jgi:hypothetical protein
MLEIDDMAVREWAEAIHLVSLPLDDHFRELAKMLDGMSPAARERWVANQEWAIVEPGPYHLTGGQRKRVAKILAAGEVTTFGKALARSDMRHCAKLAFWIQHNTIRIGANIGV